MSPVEMFWFQKPAERAVVAAGSEMNEGFYSFTSYMLPQEMASQALCWLGIKCPNTNNETALNGKKQLQ